MSEYHNITEIIDVEKKLLELEENHKFELSLDELITLNKCLKEIGDITSLYFNVQYEFSNKISNNIEKLNEYNEKLSNCVLDIDLSSTKMFITDVYKRLNR